MTAVPHIDQTTTEATTEAAGLSAPAPASVLPRLIAELNAAQADFEAAHADYTTAVANARTLEAAAQAAEADAERLREDIRETLRTLMGRPSRELRAKSAEQRAAIELATEYATLAAEVAQQTRRALLATSAPARRVNELRRQLLRAYAEELLRDTLAEVAPRLKTAIALQAHDEEIKPFNTQLSIAVMLGKDAYDMVLDRLRYPLIELFRTTEAQPVREDIATALETSGTHGFQPMSPAQVHVQRAMHIESQA